MLMQKGGATKADKGIRKTKGRRARLTDSNPDGVQKLFPAVCLDPPPIWIPVQLNLSLIHPSLHPQSDLSISYQAACNCHVEVQDVALSSDVQNVSGVGGTWSCFGFGDEGR
jgi:hypothetical protein